MYGALRWSRVLASFLPATATPLTRSGIRAQTVRACASEAARNNAIRFCIVGSGPAGFYTADKKRSSAHVTHLGPNVQLLKSFGITAEVDVLDRLPTPFGLVRSGVAPDHQHTKNVQNQFAEVAQDARVCFFGNVKLGKDVALEELRRMYDSVILAYGSESDRKLGVPGEVGGKNVLSAREFVWWYNGHPDAFSLPLDLSLVKNVAICGIGNVALDCARVILQPLERLASTDVASHAVEALREANGGAGIKHVHLIARRGVAQAACTPKELKELTTEFDLAVHSTPEQLQLSPQDEAEMKKTRMKRRVVELISKAASQPSAAVSDTEARHLHFQFNRNPVEIIINPDSKVVTGVRVEKTRQEQDGSGKTVAVGTGEHEVIPADLVLVSIGYKSLPVEGLPSFDASRGVVPNIGGRVISISSDNKDSQAGEPVPGLYVVGWLKRGPSGIIGSNLVDAQETVDCILSDYGGVLGSEGNDPSVSPTAKQQLGFTQKPALGRTALLDLLQARSVEYVTYDGWEVLNKIELEEGEKKGKIREKLVDIKGMVDMLKDRRR